MNIPYILSDNGITLIVNSEPYEVYKDDESYVPIVKAIKDDDEVAVKRLIDRKKRAVNKFARVSVDRCEVRGNSVYYDGEPLSGVLVDKILKFVEEGLPYVPLMAFLNRVMRNPSFNSRRQLYSFLEHGKMPITPDGCFLAYKGVTCDYLGCHTQSIDNSVGKSPKRLQRSQVDDNPENGCSNGYHVGSFEYGNNFGSKTMIVKVAPEDVVSVPNDSNWQKCRVTYYEVVDEYKRPFADEGKESYCEDYDDPEEELDDKEFSIGNDFL